LLCALLLAACGPSGNNHNGDTEGSYIAAGPLAYQVQMSRELNPANVEDRGYLRGLPAGTVAPTGSEEWFGVWLRAQNESKHAARSASDFDILDTQGNTYSPVPLDAAVNPFAYVPQTLSHGDVLPNPESAAASSPTQGEMLLFKLPTSVYANRPLVLRILDPATRGVLATVSLDL
jgi:hypothetical protein